MIYVKGLATKYARNAIRINIRHLHITKERTRHGTTDKTKTKEINIMSTNLIYFFCGMFAGALMEFIIAAVIIMKGDKKK